MTSGLSRSRGMMLTIVFCAAWVFVLAPEALGDQGAAVLSEAGPWRCHLTWRAEQVRRASGELEYSVTRVRKKKRTWTTVKPSQSAPPVAGWAGVEFDDGSWGRMKGPFAKSSMGQKVTPAWPRALAMLCLRGRFEVSDPARIGEITLDLAFRGGVVVYLNGKEVTRAHLPNGKITPETPAEDYPKDVYLRSDGSVLRAWGDRGLKDQFAKRVRRITGLKLSASLLKKGANVLAVEIHRAPTAEVFHTAKCRGDRRHAHWSMLSLNALKLTVSGGGLALASATDRSKGLHLWLASPMRKVRVTDRGIPGEPLRPIRLAATRNGSFSGQVVVGSSTALKGLKAEVSELRTDKGETIAASSVRVRFPLPDGPDKGYFDGLRDSAPTETPINGQSGKAIQPVWITVNVPKNAKAGKYTGKLTVSSQGAEPVEVPIELSVADWALPESKDFASFLGLIQSPDTLAKYYKVPMWSKKHWELIDKSFELMGKLGSNTVYIHLIRRTYFGNKHTMVRWIKDGDGWKHDFSIAEKYLDIAVKHLGKMPVVCLSVWHSGVGGSYFGLEGRKGPKTEKVGIPFTVLDPATGELSEAIGPMWGDEKIRVFWKPVLDGMREILTKRGLEKSMMVGWGTDIHPCKEVVADIKAVAPGTKWVVQRHPYGNNVRGVPIGYLVHVWGTSITPPPSADRVYGWKNPTIETVFPRYGCSIVGHSLRLWTDLPAYRLVVEAAVTSPGKRRIRRRGKHYGMGLRGVGRLGADFWPVLGKGRRKKSVHAFYAESLAGDGALNLSYSIHHLLSPGENGAIANVRFENVREGIQETEARIFIEKALTDPTKKARLGEQLAARCQQVLDERTIAFIRARNGASAGGGTTAPGWLWFIGSGWEKRTVDLYSSAAEVAKKLGVK